MSNATHPDASEVEFLQHLLTEQEKQIQNAQREAGRIRARLRRLQEVQAQQDVYA